MAEKFQVPDWFNLADYNYCPTLDRRGWYQVLAVRQYYREELPGMSSLGAAFDREAFWEEFRDATAEPGKWGFFPTPTLPLEEISASILKDPEKAQGFAVWEMGVEDKKLICIDLEAADTTLQDAFAKWLAERRKQRPLPVQRRGRRGKKSNVDVTPKHFEKWSCYKVPAVFDLDFWCCVFERNTAPHAALCGLLQLELRDQTDPKEWGREARRALKQALDCVDLLAREVAEGGLN